MYISIFSGNFLDYFLKYLLEKVKELVVKGFIPPVLNAIIVTRAEGIANTDIAALSAEGVQYIL